MIPVCIPPRARQGIIALVLERSAIRSNAGAEPVSRHSSTESAERHCARLNHSAQDPDGHYSTDDGLPPYVVFAKIPYVDHWVELVSWMAGIKTTGDSDWTYNGQRFATRNEAQLFSDYIRWVWHAVTDTQVVPSPDPVNYRWDDLTSRAVSLAPPAAQNAPPALPVVEQALRDAGVVVQSPDDPTEATRRVLVASINAEAAAIPEEGSRAHWEAKHGVGNVWSTAELSAAFHVHSFRAPFVVVTRLRDGVSGTLRFAHSPRYYFDFQEDR